MQKKTGDTASTTDLRAAFAKSSSAQERFDYFMANPFAQMDENLVEELAGKHFVLIGGWGSPLIEAGQKLLQLEEEKCYFGELKKNLEIIGAHVTVIYPHSVEIEDSAKEIVAEVPKLFREGGERPLVLLGQSRGGMVAFETILQAPHFLKRIDGAEPMIRKVATLQSPVHGNRLIKGPIMDPIVDVISQAGLGFLKPGGNLGVGPLGDKNIKRLFGPAALEKLSPVDRDLVDNATLWFTSNTNGSLLKALIGPSDGLVALRDQFLSHAGRFGGHFSNVNHVNAIFNMKKTYGRQVSEAVALTIMEKISLNLQHGDAFADHVSAAEGAKVRATLKRRFFKDLNARRPV